LIFVSVHFSDATSPASTVTYTTATMLNIYCVSPFYDLQIVVGILQEPETVQLLNRYSSTYGLCHAVSLPPRWI